MSIEAMRLALEALEGVRIEYDFHGNPLYDEDKKIDPAITVLRQAIKQAEKQEPVAWMRSDGTLLFADGNVFAVGQEFYTAPPKREWVGVTGDEIDDIAAESGFGYINVARAIEAKLKEKNT